MISAAGNWIQAQVFLPPERVLAGQVVEIEASPDLKCTVCFEGGGRFVGHPGSSDELDLRHPVHFACLRKWETHSKKLRCPTCRIGLSMPQVNWKERLVQALPSFAHKMSKEVALATLVNALFTAFMQGITLIALAPFEKGLTFSRICFAGVPGICIGAVIGTIVPYILFHSASAMVRALSREWQLTPLAQKGLVLLTFAAVSALAIKLTLLISAFTVNQLLLDSFLSAGQRAEVRSILQSGWRPLDSVAPEIAEVVFRMDAVESGIVISAWTASLFKMKWEWIHHYSEAR